MSPEIPWVTGRVEPGGQTFEARKNQTLLDALEQGGLPWPSSCRSGSCRTCISTLVQGQVRYEMAWPGLSPEEITEGCVLPCAAYPVTDVVLRDPFADSLTS